VGSSFEQLVEKISQCHVSDQAYLRQKLNQWQKPSGTQKNQATIERLIDSRLRLYQTKCNTKIKIEYDPQLPISQRVDDIKTALQTHQVVIVCGETGSGKTTQLPKILIDLGYGKRPMIAHTQPRRVAAKTLSQRMGAELENPLAVGYKVRFRDSVRNQSLVKVLTDGMLLAELASDRKLFQYDAIIIDEAHERSLNIDFLLGYLRSLLLDRPDLKLIITSATINTEKFSKHFFNAPIIDVSGRTYPVEIRYHEHEADAYDRALVNAVDELAHEGPGDILIFFAGEADIRHASELLRKHHPEKTEILALYSRLNESEQDKVFQTHLRRRIILATNIAETSLTVPGIHYVIDTGTARQSEFNFRTKIQRLPVRKISQASANQRAGRCGRIAPGVCIRLYSEEDYLSRPIFTTPEILRTNLASVILQMKAIGFDDIEAFPFIDKPDQRFVNSGRRLLQELQALDHQMKLTSLGMKLAKLNIDPRLGRIVLAGDQENCLHDIVVIVGLLAGMDPREKPKDKQAQAQQFHARFKDQLSAFSSILKLWAYLQQQQHDLSHNKFRKLCQSEFISFMKFREWQQIVSQLIEKVNQLGFKHANQAGSYEAVHQAIITGFVDHIGLREQDLEFVGVRDKRFYIHPKSSMHKLKAKWIVAGHIVETHKTYASVVAKIEVEWIEKQLAHLIKENCAEPYWSTKRQVAMVNCAGRIYGLPIFNQRKRNFSNIDAEKARDIFIRDGLLNGNFQPLPAFIKANLAVMQAINDDESRLRRPGQLLDEDAVARFYDERIPQKINSGHQLKHWLAGLNLEQHEALCFKREQVLKTGQENSLSQYPGSLTVNAVEYKIVYQFSPGDEQDGASVIIPLPLLSQVDAHAFSNAVPAFVLEKIVLLIKSLSKAQRRHFVPVPATAQGVLSKLKRDQDLLPQLLAQLKQLSRQTIQIQDFDESIVPAHLSINYRVVDNHQRVLAFGRDLHLLKQQLANQMQHVVNQHSETTEQLIDSKDWDFGSIDLEKVTRQQNYQIKIFPCLCVKQSQLYLTALSDAHQAERDHVAGVLFLLKRHLKQKVEYIVKQVKQQSTICLLYQPIDSQGHLVEDVVDAIFLHCFTPSVTIRDAESFDSRVAQGQSHLLSQLNQLLDALTHALKARQSINRHLKKLNQPLFLSSIQDIQLQLDYLFRPHFIRDSLFESLINYPRYLHALEKRIAKWPDKIQKDQANVRLLRPLMLWYLQEVSTEAGPELLNFGRLIEECRISLFAQEIGTQTKVSIERLNKLRGQIESL